MIAWRLLGKDERKDLKDWQLDLLKRTFPGRDELIDFILHDSLLMDLVSSFDQKMEPHQVPWSFLSSLAYRGCFFQFRRLIQFGLSPHVTDDDCGYGRYNLVHSAAEGGQAEIIKYLIEQKVDLECFDIANQTPLMKAVMSGSVEAARLLIHHGASLEEYSDIFARTPLGLAIMIGDLDMAKMLIDEGADYNEESYNNIAAESGDIEMFDFVDQLDSDWCWDDTLNSAVKSDSPAMVRYLLSQGHTNFRHSPICEAIRNNSLEMIQFLLSKEILDFFPPGAPRPSVPWPDMFEDIVECNDQAVKDWAVKTARELGLFLCDSSALFGVYSDAMLPMVKKIVEFGANVDVKDEKENTPLLIAAKNNCIEIARFLLDNQAYVDQRNQMRETALSIATENNFQELAALLIKHGARRSVPPTEDNPDGWEECDIVF